MSALPSTTSTLRLSLPRRLRAAGIHLSLSGTAFAVALYLILVVWYPGFHFRVDGGWQGVRIMAAVDLVLGPMLTLIVFNPFKARRLIVFDLACIGIAQVAALAWGFYAIHSQHPVAMSWQGGAFHPVTVEPLRVESYDPAQLASLSDAHPPMVFVAPPANDDEQTRVAMQAMVGGTAEYEDPFFFRPFKEHWPEIKAQGRTAERLHKTKPDVVDAFKAAGGPADAVFFDYQGRFGNCTVALSPQGQVLGAYGCEMD
jgi:hypothetical protein